MTQALKTALPTNVTEFLEWIEDREERYELLKGVVHMVPPPNIDHSRVISRLTHRIMNYLELNPIGEVLQNVAVYYDEKNFLIPDTCFCSNALLREVYRERKPKFIKGIPPELVIEVLSPTNKGYDLVDKKDIYESIGVEEYWIADPDERRFYFFTLMEGQYEAVKESKNGIFYSKVLPGFKLNLAEFWKAISFD